MIARIKTTLDKVVARLQSLNTNKDEITISLSLNDMKQVLSTFGSISIVNVAQNKEAQILKNRNNDLEDEKDGSKTQNVHVDNSAKKITKNNNNNHKIVGKMLRYCGKFSTYPNSPKKNRLFLYSNDNFRVELKKGARSYKIVEMDTLLKNGKEYEGVKQWWKIKFLMSDNTKVDSSTCMGVVPSDNSGVGNCPWSDVSKFYGIGGRNRVFLGDGEIHMDKHEIAKIPLDSWITVKYICNGNKDDDLIFENENVIKIYAMKLPKGNKWYPAISLSYGKYKPTCILQQPHSS